MSNESMSDMDMSLIKLHACVPYASRFFWLRRPICVSDCQKRLPHGINTFVQNIKTTNEKWEICIHLEKSPLLIEGFTILLMRVSFYSLQALLLSVLPLPPIDWWWMSRIKTHVSPSQLVFWISLSLSLFSLHYSDVFFLDFFFLFLKLKYWKLLEVWNQSRSLLLDVLCSNSLLDYVNQCP